MTSPLTYAAALDEMLTLQMAPPDQVLPNTWKRDDKEWEKNRQKISHAAVSRLNASSYTVACTGSNIPTFPFYVYRRFSFNILASIREWVGYTVLWWHFEFCPRLASKLPEMLSTFSPLFSTRLQCQEAFLESIYVVLYDSGATLRKWNEIYAGSPSKHVFAKTSPHFMQLKFYFYMVAVGTEWYKQTKWIWQCWVFPLSEFTFHALCKRCDTSPSLPGSLPLVFFVCVP